MNSMLSAMINGTRVVRTGDHSAQPSVFPIRLPSGRWVVWAVFAWVAASLLMLMRLVVSYLILERRKQRACPLFRRKLIVYVGAIVASALALLWLGLQSFERQRQVLTAFLSRSA
jgi:hypothetical protein